MENPKAKALENAKKMDLSINKSKRRRFEKTGKQMKKEGYKGYFNSMTGEKSPNIPF
jgi:hypothetical protein